MKISQVIKNAKEMSTVGVDLLLRQYPPFVYGRGLVDNQIPIFVLHSVDPQPFERMLQFLASNNYETLTTEDLLDIHENADREVPRKSIMLTFDDGMKSVWCFAYPLLKRYGFKASTFLIPGRIPEASSIDPNLEDVWEGRAKAEDIGNQSMPGHEPLANWEEIRVMHESGVIDFQSHTYGHELIFTKPVITDFLSPQLIDKYHQFEFPRTCIESGRVEGRYPFGMPLYATSPRMSDDLRYIEDQGLSQECVNYVSEKDLAFFEQPDWRDELRVVVQKYKDSHADKSGYESAENQEKAIYDDLNGSKIEIEKRLQGKVVRSLCFPWGQGGELALKIAKSLGFDAVYWDKVDGKLIYQRHDDPLKISRIGEDFLHLLPGTGRQSLTKLILKKVKRRIQQGSPFLSH